MARLSRAVSGRHKKKGVCVAEEASRVGVERRPRIAPTRKFFPAAGGAVCDHVQSLVCPYCPNEP